MRGWIIFFAIAFATMIIVAIVIRFRPTPVEQVKEWNSKLLTWDKARAENDGYFVIRLPRDPAETVVLETEGKPFTVKPFNSGPAWIRYLDADGKAITEYFSCTGKAPKALHPRDIGSVEIRVPDYYNPKLSAAMVKVKVYKTAGVKKKT